LAKKQYKEEKDPLHRGRFQAQGKSLEESVKWERNTPLTVKEGKRLLNKLRDKLTNSDLKIRESAFSKQNLNIDRIFKNGGIDIGKMRKNYSKSFEPGIKERVDIEIFLGKAFIRQE